MLVLGARLNEKKSNLGQQLIYNVSNDVLIIAIEDH